MSDFMLYVNVILITAFICGFYGVVYVTKVIVSQRKIEDEILKTIKELKNK